MEFYKGGNFFSEDFTMADRLWNFAAMKNCDKEKGNEPSLKDVWLKSIELMISRTGKGLFVASHGGHNAESHNHNDVGDFIVYYKEIYFFGIVYPRFYFMTF